MTDRSMDAVLDRVGDDPRYRDLVRRRSRFAWQLSAAVIAVFFGYILLIAFHPAFLARPISGGSTTTIGIPIGLGVILFGILVTGVYVRHANRHYDPIVDALTAEAGE